MQTLESIHINGVTLCSLCKNNDKPSYLVSHSYTIRDYYGKETQLEPIDFHHSDSNHQNHAINACIKTLCEYYNTSRDQVVLTGMLRFVEPELDGAGTDSLRYEEPVVEVVEKETSMDTNSYTLKFEIAGVNVVSAPITNAFEAMRDALALYENHSISEVEVVENNYDVVARVNYGQLELVGIPFS